MPVNIAACLLTLTSAMEDVIIQRLQSNFNGRSELVSSSGTHPPPSSHRSGQYDKTKVCHLDLQAVLGDFVTASWSQDIESHVDSFNQTLLSGISKRCPRSSSTPKKPFITPELWHLRHCKLHHRAKLKELDRRHRWETLQHCFLALRRSRSSVRPSTSSM